MISKMTLVGALFMSSTVWASTSFAASAAGKYIVVVGMASEAKVAKGDNAIVVVGAMRSKTLRAKLEAIDTSNVAGVISFGVAGGLDEKLKVGALIVPKAVLFEGGALPVSAELSATIRASVQGKGLDAHGDMTLVGIDSLATGTTEFRQELHKQTGAHVVDMESHIAAQFAASRQLPFAVVRTLSDTVGDVMPPAAMLELGENGEVQLGKVMASIGRNPFQIAALIRTGRNFKAGLETLKKSRSALSFLFGRE